MLVTACSIRLAYSALVVLSKLWLTTCDCQVVSVMHGWRTVQYACEHFAVCHWLSGWQPNLTAKHFSSQANPFGSAKPVDTVARLKELEERDARRKVHL